MKKEKNLFEEYFENHYTDYDYDYDYDYWNSYWHTPIISNKNKRILFDDNELFSYKFNKEIIKETYLDYDYVEQLASAIASGNSVRAQIGNSWNINLGNKILTYNPVDLMFEPRARAIMLILHEVGHLLHTSSVNSDKSVFLKRYETKAQEILNLFEDIRIDEIMSQSYPSSEEVYKENEKMKEELIEKYFSKNKEVEKLKKRAIIELLTNLVSYLKRHKNEKYSEKITKEFFDDFKAYLRDHLIFFIDEDSLIAAANKAVCFIGEIILANNNIDEIIKQLEERLEEEKKKIDKENKAIGSKYFQYILGIINETLKTPKKLDILKEVKEKVNKTKKYIKDIIKAKSTDEVLEILNKNIYPEIEEYIKEEEYANYFNEIFKVLSGIIQEVIIEEINKTSEAIIKESVEDLEKKPSFEVNFETKISEKEGTEIPSSWANGDYNSLYKSIKSLIEKTKRELKEIKSEDLADIKIRNQKKGKLDIKSVYKIANDNYEIFLNRKRNIDRINETAISLIVDRSRSMDADMKNINAARNTILLNEALKSLNIPFEVITFNDRAERLLDFDSKDDKSLKEKLSMITKPSGKTNIIEALKETKIREINKNNKILIIISDGEDVNSSEYIKKNFEEIKNRNNISALFLFIDTDTIKSDDENFDVAKCTRVGKAIKEAFGEKGMVKLVNSVSEIPKIIKEFVLKVIKNYK
jgi:hypothetical protein